MTKLTKRISVAMLAVMTCLGLFTPIFAEESDPEVPTDVLDGGDDTSVKEDKTEKPGKGGGLLEYDRIPDLTGIDTANIKIRYFDD